MFERGHGDGSTVNVQWIPMNMYETTDALVIVVPMPGVRASDVVIELEGRRLRLHSDLRTPAPKEYMLHEWDYGLFERVVELPHGYGARIAATLGHGQLVVRVARLADPTSDVDGDVRSMHPAEPLSGPMRDGIGGRSHSVGGVLGLVDGG